MNTEPFQPADCLHSHLEMFVIETTYAVHLAAPLEIILRSFGTITPFKCEVSFCPDGRLTEALYNQTAVLTRKE